MKKIKIKLLILLVFFAFKFYGQDTTNYLGTGMSMPVSWTYLDTAFIVGDSNSVLPPANSSQNFRQALNSYSLPNYDNAILQAKADYIAQTCKKCAYGKRIGKGNINTVDVKTNAQYYNPHIAGGKLWIMHITSPTALGLMFYFSKFKIPQFSSLSIYTADRSQILGPYTNSNNNSDTTQGIQFETLPITAKDVFVEYYESDSADFTGSIVLDNIIHLFNNTYSSISPPPSTSAHCQKDACNLVNYAKEANSVALILAYDVADSSLVTCSGSLLNNTNQDGTPYFLTASHCLGSSTTSSIYNTTTWVFIFDYQKKCTGSTTSIVPYQKVIYGATTSNPHNPLSYDIHCIDSENSITSDYLFLQLNDNPQGSVLLMDLCYSGWLYGDPLASSQYYNFDTASSIIVIHHPKGDYKKISIGGNLRSADGTGGNDCSSTDPNWTGDYFFNMDINNSGQIPYYGGGIEEGSSGSPIYVDNGGFPRLIGTVTGANPTDTVSVSPVIDACDQGSYTGFYSKFFQDWNNDPVAFSTYLDPNNNHSNPSFTGINTWCSTATPGNSNINSQYTSQGIKINGETGIPILCLPVINIELEPLVADNFKFNNTSSLISCNSVPSEICYTTGIASQNCHTDLFSYTIFLSPLTDNGSVITTYKHTFNDYCSNLGVVIPNNSGTNNERDIPSIKVFTNDIHHFPGPGRAPGGNLPPGYWRIGIGTSYNGWKYSFRDFYVLPDTLVRANAQIDTISSSLIASTSVTLENVFVPKSASAYIGATDFIELEDKSHIESGHYFIENVGCSSHLRAANSNSNKQFSNAHSLTNNNQSNIIQTNNSNQVSTINKNRSEILIYPNPTNNDVVLDFKNSSFTNNDITFKVFNSMGQLVRNQITSLNGNTQFSLGLSDLNAGIYNIIITQGVKVFQSKVVKQ